MKKLIYISFIFAFILAFTSCEKEVISPNFDISSDASENSQTRGGDDEVVPGGDTVTDPDEDDDFDGDEDKNGGITDPDEDEDFDEDEGGK
mgnify:CR=1 FL=1